MSLPRDRRLPRLAPARPRIVGATATVVTATMGMVTMLSALFASAAAAQTITAGWSDGFVVRSADGDHRLQIGAVVQADGRFSIGEERPFTDAFVLRKARPTLSGRVAKHFDFKITSDFAGGSAVLVDGYVDIRFSEAFKFRSGKDKTPIGYEVLLSDSTLLFPERSLVSLLLPSRDVGFQAVGELAGGRLLYAAGLFNGQPVDGGSSSTDVDTNDGKDVAGRVAFRPFKSDAAPPSLLNNFGVHLGVSTGNQDGALPSFRTSAGQTFFSYAATTADGRRTRIAPAVFLYAGRVGAFAEFARSTQAVARGGTRAELDNRAWGVNASYVLTGEATSERGVKPRAPFDPAAGQWGAVQLTARYGALTIDDDAFALGLAASSASRTAHQLTLGSGWYLSDFVKLYGTYERTRFDGGAERPPEHAVLFRTQLAF